MKIFSIIFLFLLISCAHEPVRGPASVDTDYHYGDFEKSKSFVRIFPPEIDGETFRYFFYVNLKDAWGGFVDCDSHEFKVQETKTKKFVPYRVQRMLSGRYYVIVETKKQFSPGEVDILARGQVLNEQFKITLGKVDPGHSRLTLVSKKNHRAKFRLKLHDSKGVPVEIPTLPEIILDKNEAEIEDIRHVKEGVWEFKLHYPENNLVTYINVRAHGVYLEKIFRFHHIEK